VYDEIVVDKCHDRWAAYLDDLWAADSDGVHTVLDLCCGTGLMADALRKLGYRVTGVDGSPAMLARGRQLLGPDAVLIQQTLPCLVIGGVFDAVVSTFDGLNYLTPAEFRSTLAAVSRRLRRGGWLVFDLHTDAMLRFAMSHPTVQGDVDGKRFTISNIVDDNTRSCVTRIELTGATEADTFSEQHRQYFFRAAEVQCALADAGFGQPSVTDEYTRQRATRSTLRATWVSRLTAGR
jgi:predicted TPR repeat methyltransferase